MQLNVKLALAALATLLLSACSTSTHISSIQAGTMVRIKGDAAGNKITDGGIEEKVAYATPRKENFSVSTFGKYEFKAELAGQEPFYGMLPRMFHGGYLALDILFFTPAMLFNLNGVYPHYEFDVPTKTLRYREKEADNWSTYQPSVYEINRARDYFGDSSPAAPVSAAQTAPATSL